MSQSARQGWQVGSFFRVPLIKIQPIGWSVDFVLSRYPMGSFDHGVSVL
ncbi:MAG: hypothetical protein JW829_14460 [Pirellulales bacterium]|nr:hypothetical protein [Pirellulales bacterium]